MKVFKYAVNVGDNEVTLPKGAKVLSFQAQNENLFFWALVDEKEELLEKREFHVAGTGHDLPFGKDICEKGSHLGYHGTAQQGGGTFIWHLFEIVRVSAVPAKA